MREENGESFGSTRAERCRPSRELANTVLAATRGPTRSAQLLSVGGITVDRFGDVWFADTISRRIPVLRSQID